MVKLSAMIEGILFVANRPLSLATLAEAVGREVGEVEVAVVELVDEYNEGERAKGIKLIMMNDQVQMVTAPECSEVIQDFLHEETTSDLSKSALETLTIIAYRGPISRSELEQIRGVHCQTILRNLQMRGLVSAKGDDRALATTYQVTMEFLRHLGVTRVHDLPEYTQLRSQATAQ